VEVLAEESARLDAMARSFAQFGRLPDGPAAEIDVGELVTRVVRNTLPDTLTQVVTIEDDLPLIIGDHEALVRAVTNVLLNAVDASTPGGTISVSVSCEGDLPEAKQVVIAIADQGAGMTQDVMSRIFDPYVTTKPGGTGLGLAIARQTLSAHHGTIEAASTVGVGTVLRLRLPVTATQGVETP
jgi:signal transduction histidine kinase